MGMKEKFIEARELEAMAGDNTRNAALDVATQAEAKAQRIKAEQAAADASAQQEQGSSPQPPTI